tara:strand:- start:95 stop:625 length:531 start_codon:yes stop_codon:yes gene_type:complete
MEIQFIIKSVDRKPEGYPIQASNALECGLIHKPPTSMYIVPSMLEGTGYVLYIHTQPPQNANPLKTYVEDPLVFDEDRECYVQTYTLVDRVFTSAEKQEVVDTGINVLKSEIRTKRDALLLRTDFTQIGDVPFDKPKWSTYRQALRDITSQEGFSTGSVTWPEPPFSLDPVTVSTT